MVVSSRQFVISMSTVLNRPAANPWATNPWLAWAPIAVGLAVLYIPTDVSLWNTLWQTEEQGHGPLILAVAAWLIWQKRAVLVDGDARPSAIAGYSLLVFGLLLYVVGRSQDILLFEVGSQIPVLAATLLIVRGSSALRALAFPLFFLVFMIPLPGILVDALTGPLKREVSEIAEHILYLAGYPIARSGVTLQIGPYQLLVADACSGLHSLYSLSALGLLYLYLMRHASWLRNAVIAAAILPIAFGANVIRVIFLVLVTYHFGDEAGQGFLHGFSGIALFLAALMLLFALDSMVGFVLGKWSLSTDRSGA
jgi:exosortase B